MSGLYWWAFEHSPLHAELLASGWQESRVWKLVHGERVSVLMVKIGKKKEIHASHKEARVSGC